MSNESITPKQNPTLGEGPDQPIAEMNQGRTSTLHCPKCSASRIAYSRLQQFDALTMRFIAKRPYRCLQCYHRFWVHEKIIANSKRVWTLAIVALLLVVFLLRAFGILSASEQTAQVSVVAPEFKQPESDDDVLPQSESAPRLASLINMPQSAGQNDASMGAQVVPSSNREINQAPEESLTAEQRAGRLLLAKQQAKVAAQISQARVEQLERILLPAEDELESLVKVEVSYMVERWREAWSNGNLNKYLLSYSSNFKPANDQSFEQWQVKRMSRVSPDKNIVIELADFDVVMLEQLSSAVVEFNQHYQAGSVVENSRKRLRLAKEQGTWKIMAEVELP
ncbi:MAG: hypothetical protein JKX81_14990 [Arenicella sp.]|nr:hypothetical protein [Arenicella sp.]